MPIAQTYNRQYNFTNWQTGNPASPLPGNQVDIELSQIKVTLDAMLANVALIQRSDGALANGSVGNAQLSPALTFGFTFRGLWVTGTTYAQNDGVFYNTRFYIALFGLTPSTITPDVDSANWNVAADFTGTSTGTATAAATAAAASAAAALVSQNAASASASAASSTASTSATANGVSVAAAAASATSAAASATSAAASAATAVAASTATVIAMGSSFKNRFINGALQVNNYTLSGPVLLVAGAAVLYFMDRFYACSVGGNGSAQSQNATATADPGSVKISGASSVTSQSFGQRIEAIRIADLAGSTVTLSAKLANSLLTTISWAAYCPIFGTDSWGSTPGGTGTLIASGAFTVSATSARYSATFALPAGAASGIDVFLSVGAQTSGNWTIQDMQLEVGTAATAFEALPLTVTQQLCARYYPFFLDTASGASALGDAYATTTTAVVGSFTFLVPPRMAPTGIKTSGATNFTFSGVATLATTAAVFNTFTSAVKGVATFTVAGATAGQAGVLRVNTGGAWIAFTGCEL